MGSSLGECLMARFESRCMSEWHCTIGSDFKEVENEKHDTTQTRLGWRVAMGHMVYHH